MKRSKLKTTEKHNYDNRRSFDDKPLAEGECLVPVHVDPQSVGHIPTHNAETWPIGPGKVLALFCAAPAGCKEGLLRVFNRFVREHYAESKREREHISLEEYMNSSEYSLLASSGDDPTCDTATTNECFNQYLSALKMIDPLYVPIICGLILKIPKSKIRKMLNLPKFGTKIEKAIKAARMLYPHHFQ